MTRDQVGRTKDYVIGWNAHCSCERFTDNPHHHTTGCHREWQDGG